MKPERYARLQEIVEGARELRGDQLEAYLESTCSGDDKLREEARTLLVAGRDSEAGIFGERSIDGVRLELGGLFADGHGPALLPTVIGPYRILRQIGRGGMGIVYEARQEGPDRTVALKVLRPELVDGGLLKRFHQEAEVLALLQHPGVARIFDAGTCNLGGGEMPYFAMELIEGQELGEFARSHDLGLRARVRLVARICEAVQHAHERGVIHRDLKPANVLVVDGTGHDGPRPVVLDFGIARSTDPERQRQKHWTQTGQVLGTLDYMSPEQLDGFGEVVDQRADIYALGVILYELLCGRLPLDLEGTSLASVGRVIRDVEPARLGTLRPECRGDLEVVCAKALRKERALRYGSAAEFGEDLNRFLADQPVSARPSSTWYQVVKFARRNRAFVTSVAVAFAVLAIGVAVSVPLAVYAERSEQSARDSLSRFEIKVSEFDQLAGVAKLESAIERERALFPAWPHMTSALEQWLDGECDSLLAMRPKMKQTTEQFASAPGGVTAATSARFLNDALVKLLEDLAGFESQQKANVERRLRWAAGVREWTRFHPGARVSWQTVA
ncbi:MAG: serine/threonine protein kinase, partial [Planctomycetota bacterium]